MHVHIDKVGFVWVNLDASDTPAIPWDRDFGAVDEQPRYQMFDMDSYTFHHQWAMIGDYNWKTLADNYNEACVSNLLVHPVNLLTWAGCSATTVSRVILLFKTSPTWISTGLKRTAGISNISIRICPAKKVWGITVPTCTPMHQRPYRKSMHLLSWYFALHSTNVLASVQPHFLFHPTLCSYLGNTNKYGV